MVVQATHGVVFSATLVSKYSQMGVSIVMGVPQNGWMVCFMENPNQKLDDDWGYPYDLGNPHVYT